MGMGTVIVVKEDEIDAAKIDDDNENDNDTDDGNDIYESMMRIIINNNKCYDKFRQNNISINNHKNKKETCKYRASSPIPIPFNKSVMK